MSKPDPHFFGSWHLSYPMTPPKKKEPLRRWVFLSHKMAPRAGQHAKPLTSKAKKLMRQLGPMRLQISLGGITGLGTPLKQAEHVFCGIDVHDALRPERCVV